MPKARITKDMVVDAAFEIVRTEGASAINARSISRKLNCSTQPVLYSFSSIEEIRQAAFRKAEQFHTAYFMNVQGELDNPLLEIALRYIRFAEEEKNLFRFLFQSDYFINRDISDWSREEKLAPVIALMQSQTELSEASARDLFLSIYLTMHGYASMFACNSLKYDEAAVVQTLIRTYSGVASALIQEAAQRFIK